MEGKECAWYVSRCMGMSHSIIRHRRYVQDRVQALARAALERRGCTGPLGTPRFYWFRARRLTRFQMERIWQMKVIPDLLPDLRPTIDLRVNYPEPPPESVYLRTRVKRKYKQVEPGIFLLPEQVYNFLWYPKIARPY